MLGPVLLVLLAALLITVGLLFNRLVGLRNRAAAAWSDIDVQLKQRHDLIRNLVETVKGYAAHERSTLEEVTRARAGAEGAREAGAPGNAGEAESHLSERIGRLFAIVEAYPDLKASDGFRQLHTSLVEVEDKLQNARRYYNAVVRDLNTRIQSFPDLFVARIFGFAEREFFELDSAAEAAVPRFDLEG
ncbi:MAG: LemA family protein [Acidobacteria bacterium]|nr:LemA family protein [Acidobacteriota bacterium]NIM63058.1 LemA family protein [Acidobacteriota bacterium]NIO59935.1 LemA family protein [Acidobacteriota bacterium]NIQ31002.1 LemA family protein [Acidobacteriota bacterium]NIQ86130.1 LemA family protein [Acidobacteriota bacterium]